MAGRRVFFLASSPGQCSCNARLPIVRVHGQINVIVPRDSTLWRPGSAWQGTPYLVGWGEQRDRLGRKECQDAKMIVSFENYTDGLAYLSEIRVLAATQPPCIPGSRACSITHRVRQHVILALFTLLLVWWCCALNS